MGNIGERIKEARLRNDWSQEELAKKMGYKSKSTINKIELGINDVTQKKVAKFAEVLGVPISFLMDWGRVEIFTGTAVLKAVTPEEERLLESFEKLNEEGKTQLLKQLGYMLSDEELIISETKKTAATQLPQGDGPHQ